MQKATRYDEHPTFRTIEIVCNLWFTFEYLLRFCITPQKKMFSCEILNIVDLLSVVPFYTELAFDRIGLNTETLSNVRGALLVVSVYASKIT